METYSLLKELNQIGSNKDEDNERVAKLIEAHDPKPDKCNAESLNLINSLVADKTCESKSIVSYLDKCVQKQFLVCSRDFYLQLKSSVDRLDEDTIELLDRIKEAYIAPIIDINDVSISHKPLTPNELARVLEQFEHGQMTSLEMREEFVAGEDMKKLVPEQMKTISDICNYALKVTEAPLNNYIALGDRPKVHEWFDQYVREWVAKLFLCRNILRGFEVHGTKLIIEAATLRQIDIALHLE